MEIGCRPLNRTDLSYLVVSRILQQPEKSVKGGGPDLAGTAALLSRGGGHRLLVQEVLDFLHQTDDRLFLRRHLGLERRP